MVNVHALSNIDDVNHHNNEITKKHICLKIFVCRLFYKHTHMLNVDD